MRLLCIHHQWTGDLRLDPDGVLPCWNKLNQVVK